MANLDLALVTQCFARLSHQLQDFIVDSMAHNSARVKSGASVYCAMQPCYLWMHAQQDHEEAKLQERPEVSPVACTV